MTSAQAPLPDGDRGPIRVLWLIKGLGAGGAERLVLLAAADRDRDSVRPRVVYLLAHKRALVPDLERAGVPVACLDARRSWDARWILRLRRILRDEPVDVVHVHSPLGAIGARVALRSLPRRARVPLVVTEHNEWQSHARPTRLADRLTARDDEVHLAVSEAVRASMPARLRSNTRVVRYGIDVDAVRAVAPRRAAAREVLGVSDDDLVVGTVANLRATKGYPDLLAAAAIVGRRSERARFVAIGQGPLARELDELRERTGVRDRFTFLGYRADALELMTAFDVFCLASRHEGLPVALMEALALGLPVVATTAGGVAELVRDGCEALLVPPGDPARLAAALVALLEDPERRARLSACAKQRADALDAVGAVRAVEAVYREVAAR